MIKMTSCLSLKGQCHLKNTSFYRKKNKQKRYLFKIKKFMEKNTQFYMINIRIGYYVIT